MHDVVISGAGPSGSQCARVLAEAGFNVALIEKNCNWRKPCGGAVHPGVFELCPELKKLDLPKLRQVVMYSADYHRLQYQSSEMAHGAIVDRLEFDNFIREKAVEAGTELFDNTLSFEFLMKEGIRKGIKTKSTSGIREINGMIIILADGMSSKLAPKSGLRSKWKIDQIALAKCSIVEGNHQFDTETAYIFFRPYKGYGWVFPHDNKKLNIGVYTFAEDNLNRNLHETYNDFLQNPHIRKNLPLSYEVTWTGSYPFPIEGVLQKSLLDDNIMIVGDAAGFISPISGEGIQSAMISGKIAAEVAINALEAQDHSKNALKGYKRHAEIKAISAEYKIKRSLIDFLYENEGANLNRMLALTEKKPDFKTQVIKMFISENMEIPDKEFFSKFK